MIRWVRRASKEVGERVEEALLRRLMPRKRERRSRDSGGEEGGLGVVVIRIVA